MTTPIPGDDNYGDHLADVLIGSSTAGEPIKLIDVASLHPTPVTLTHVQIMELAGLTQVRKVETPKPVARPRKERSTPVRNPAFREHEGLKELQRQLNRNNK